MTRGFLYFEAVCFVVGDNFMRSGFIFSILDQSFEGERIERVASFSQDTGSGHPLHLNSSTTALS